MRFTAVGFKLWLVSCAGESMESYVMRGVLNFIGTSDAKYISDLPFKYVLIL